MFALPAPALAQDLEGAWALRIDGANIFRFELERGEGDEWHARWTRPESFGSNGAVFSQLSGTETLDAMAGFITDGEVEIAFPDPRSGAVPDIFRLRALSADTAELTYVGTGFAPYPLVRVAPGMKLGPFDNERIYDRDNAERAFAYAPEKREAEPQPAPPADAEEPAQAGQPPARITADFLDDF